MSGDFLNPNKTTQETFDGHTTQFSETLEEEETLPQWSLDFNKWGQELSSALVPLRALQEDLEYHSEQGEYPRPEMIQAEVKAAAAMMPLLKAILHEMQNWPNAPSVRGPRKKEVKESKKK